MPDRQTLAAHPEITHVSRDLGAEIEGHTNRAMPQQLLNQLGMVVRRG